MKSINLLLLLLLTFVACKSSKNSSNNPQTDMDTIQFEVLKSGEYCGINEAQQILISSQEAWEKIWKEVHKNELPTPQTVEVDFSKKWVVACFMGMKSSGGHKIEISSIQMEKAHLLIHANEYAPGRNCVATMALTQPYQFVLIDPQTTEEIGYSSELVREDC